MQLTSGWNRNGSIDHDNGSIDEWQLARGVDDHYRAGGSQGRLLDGNEGNDPEHLVGH